MKSFSDEIKAEAEKINKGFERIVRSTAIACFSNIIFGSPVNEGRFRGNWFASTSAPSSKVTESTDKNGSKTAKAATEVVLHVKDWNVFQLTNNLPYAEVIEFGGFPDPVEKGSWNKQKKTFEKLSANGYSKQAPAGVVRVNIALAEQNLRKAKL